MDRISGSKRRHQGLRTGFPLTKVNYGRVLSRWMEISLISFFQNLAHLFLVLATRVLETAYVREHKSGSADHHPSHRLGCPRQQTAFHRTGRLLTAARPLARLQHTVTNCSCLLQRTLGCNRTSSLGASSTMRRQRP